ncbi:hypothetical protein [Rhodococcus sp. IEGM 1408]|uniref:hypothetical protein n=1 Tax=Rhodococcus sp. IEGM 1408 TaxID=3082220 RepID=UPI0029547C24|nr:hypothetical protein [Rhodococcus sp. IEGM 1408]MDV8003171.1 hypothetical protein [Rhodococcus sp. IEGM 1408]
MSLETPTAPPIAGTPAAQAHQKLAELRRLTATHPREMALQTQRLTESWVRRLLVLALVTEQWPAETLDMMTAPPEPDYRAIAAENAALRAEQERRDLEDGKAA